MRYRNFPDLTYVVRTVDREEEVVANSFQEAKKRGKELIEDNPEAEGVQILKLMGTIEKGAE